MPSSFKFTMPLFLRWHYANVVLFVWKLIRAVVFSRRTSPQRTYISKESTRIWIRKHKSQLALWIFKESQRERGLAFTSTAFISVLLIITLISPENDRWEESVNQEGRRSGRGALPQNNVHDFPPLPRGSPWKLCEGWHVTVWIYPNIPTNYRPSLTEYTSSSYLLKTDTM